MRSHDGSDAIRTSIDAALTHARAEWDEPPTDDLGTVALVASFGDTSLRIQACADVAVERARDLVSAGWKVELRDARDRPLEWTGATVRRRPVEESPPSYEAPLPADADPPTLPTPVIERLRETA